MRAGGRPVDPRRDMYIQHFHLHITPKKRKRLTRQLLDQLDRCKDDEARILILTGIAK